MRHVHNVDNVQRPFKIQWNLYCLRTDASDPSIEVGLGFVNNRPSLWHYIGWIQARATTSCKSTWDTVPYFGVNGLSMILCLWSPLHPLSKLLAIQDHTQNLEEQLWMGGRREVSIIFYRPVTRSDLKQERSFFRESVSSFLQLVVAVHRAKWDNSVCETSIIIIIVPLKISTVFVVSHFLSARVSPEWRLNPFFWNLENVSVSPE